MNPMRSTNSRRDEETKSTHNEDHNIHLQLRTEEERQRRRREWRLEQELLRQHEKLKRQMILDYERRRAEALKAKQKSSHHSRSRSRSKSPYRPNRRSTSKSDAAFEKRSESAGGTLPLFNGPEGTKISATELRRIKVDIHRNIPIRGPVAELNREILSPEDVVVKRRQGEGNKPIFEREEIKKAIIKANEVEERRTVVAVDGEQSVSMSKAQPSKKHSSSLSPTRNRSYSPGYRSSYQSRYRVDSKHYDNAERRDHRKNDGSFVEERDRDRYRDRSTERLQQRRDRGRSRERRDLVPRYIEPVPVPIYYSNFSPRPIVVSPMVPIRGQVPNMTRGRHPPLMAPVRPYPPRFVPSDMYRMRPPAPNPRYGPMF